MLNDEEDNHTLKNGGHLNSNPTQQYIDGISLEKNETMANGIYSNGTVRSRK